MQKVNILFNDNSKVIAVVHEAEVSEGCLGLDLGTNSGGVHAKLLPLHTLKCVDITLTDDTEVSYDEA